jgi:hypothetical protein
MNYLSVSLAMKLYLSRMSDFASLSKLKKSPVTARFPDPFLLIWTMWSSKSKYYPLTVC